MPVPVGAAACRLAMLALVELAKFKMPLVVLATPKVRPPAPCTAKVLLAVVEPFKLIAPLPVLKLPVPVWLKLPVVVIPVAAVIAPVLETAKAPALMLRLLPLRTPVAVTAAPWMVAVVVILLPVEIVPKPLVIEPAARAPVLVILPWTMAGKVVLKLGKPVVGSVTKTALLTEVVAWIAPVALPYKIPFDARVVAPVPPLATARVVLK